MTGMYIFSADNEETRHCMHVSVEDKIPRERVIDNFSDTTYAELLQIEQNTPGFYAWGVPPGPQNIMNWLYMANGDIVLGISEGAYKYAAEVVGRYENPKAATAIWGAAPGSGESREYIFFMSEPVKINIPVKKLTEWLPVAEDEFVRIEDHHLQDIRGDFGTLKRFFKDSILHQRDRPPSLDISGIFKSVEDTATATGVFQPISVTDARTRHFEAIIRRRGHPRFRQALIRAYNGRCAISGCRSLDVLEAALIRPYRGDHTYSISNGILMRSDLHTLFDLGRIGIDTRDMSVLLKEGLKKTSYRVLEGRTLRLPERHDLQPNVEALDAHRATWGL